ncbi:MAG: class I SAM-dependent methyltransferase [Candidatus Magasanikbacteria bacterium]|nr:class I SAM-dependent methyltransferase [Candidatus Magasanikbacteria bacterium]
MNIYSKYIFPWILDKFMGLGSFQEKRKEVLASAEEKVLEIGLGTGLNLAEYPAHIKTITSVDVNIGMNSYIKKRAKSAGKTIDHQVITAEKLPMADQTFDTVVSTWTLCSIPNVHQALEEINRVLKHNGKFIFIEHGLGKKKSTQIWQKRLGPFWKKVGDGCHLDRNIKDLISSHAFKITEYKEFDMRNMPKLTSHMYQGIALKKTKSIIPKEKIQN